MQPGTICHFEIPADDIGALRSFYETMFGWQISSMPGFEDYWGIQIGPEGETLNGAIMKRQAPQHTPIMYVLVDSVSDRVAKAKELGATVVVDKSEIPGIGWFACLLDPETNSIGLFEAKKG